MTDKKTPQEYIQYYTDKLTEKFNNRGIQINKVGVIGFFMNLLGWTRFDIENYYESLLKETSLLTAQTYENIIFRAAVYGYEPTFATPSVATGTISFDFDAIPKNPNAVRYEIIIGNTASPITYIDTDGIQKSLTVPSINFQLEERNLVFSSTSTYRFSKTVIDEMHSTYNVILQDENLNVQQIPFSNSYLSVPLVDFKQYELVQVSFKIPYYKIGSFYTYEIELEQDEFITDINVFIKLPYEDVYRRFDVKHTKYFSNSLDRCVFFRWITFNKYAIDFGSGHHGLNVSGSDCYITYKKTKGSYGNINVTCQSTGIYTPSCTLIMYDDNDNIISSTPFDFGKVAKIDVISSEGGKNVVDIDDFRRDVIKYIQTRDNLVSETDFYNVFDKYLDDFEILFKKTAVFENTFYLYRVIRDKYQLPVYTKTHTVLSQDFTQQYHPSFTIDGIEYISPFYYKYDPDMKWYDAILVIDEQIVYFSQTNIVDYDDIIPTLYLKVVYDETNNQTLFYLRSYQDISSRKFVITIPQLNVLNQSMTQIDSTTYSYAIDDITTTGLTVLISECDPNVSGKTYYTMSTDIIFYIAYDVSDLVRCQIYNDGTNDYVINIPLIDKAKFESDRQYYYNLLISYLVNLRLTENRMITDNIQTRFFETQLVKQLYHNDLLKQIYDFDIKLPLNLTIQLVINKDVIVANQINLDNELTQIIEDVANFITDNSGSNISIYSSKIIDTVLNEKRQEYIKNVVVSITDSDGNIIDKGLESKSLDTFLRDFSGSKLDIVKFTPVYWWFDINNIDIQTVLD